MPAGNPVVSGTIIDTNWANPTLSDVAAEIQDSLSRSGKGGMLVALTFVDGSMALPGIAWNNEPKTGLYRAGTRDQRVAVNGIDSFRWTENGVQVWDDAQSLWFDVLSTDDQITVPDTTPQNIVIKEVNTTAYTLEQADLGAIVNLNSATTVNVEVPDDLDVGFNCELVQGGNGKVVLSAGGTALLQSAGGADRTRNIWSAVAVQKLNSLDVLLAGDIETLQVPPPVIPTGSFMLAAYEDAEGGAMAPTYSIGNDTDGYRSVSFSNTTNELVARSGEAINTGQRYFEIVIDSAGFGLFGWDVGLFVGSPDDWDESYFILNQSGDFESFDGVTVRNGSGDAWIPGDVIGIACDFDGGQYEFNRNGGAFFGFSAGDTFASGMVPGIRVQNGNTEDGQFTINYTFGDLVGVLPENYKPWIGDEIGVAPPPPAITWSGDTVNANLNAASGTSTARYTWLSDGGAEWRKNGGAPLTRSNWFETKAVGLGAGYELRASLTSGTLPTDTNITIDGSTWNPLVAGLYMQNEDSDPSFGGTTSVLSVTIRENGNAASEDTATLTLISDFEGFV